MSKIKKAIIFHGAFGSPNENWFPWLSEKLKNLNMEVHMPNFPTPEGQDLESWRNVFKDYEQFLDETTIFIGHSLGPAFALDVLERTSQKIHSSYFVAGFLGLLDDPTFDDINISITEREFNWMEIKKSCIDFHLFNSDSDPYVPLSKGEELAKFLDGELTVISNGGHLNKSAGFSEIPFLLECISKSINEK